MSDGSKEKVRRRRVLGGIGASGIAAAIAVFGRSGPAAATYNVACCHLSWAPNRTIAQCLAARYHYVWHCWHAGYVRCQCCEIENSAGTDLYSAYSCN
jgi:hypothetical protein